MTRIAAPIASVPQWRHLALGDVDSTNAEAMRLARAGEPGGLWVTARRQLEGRGRRGRHWVSEPGNLYASLLLELSPRDAIGNLPLVAALAVHRALRPLFGRAAHALSIKWPNDILVDGAKVNGILLESVQLSADRLAVVIGCGINCAHHPADTLYPTTDLRSCGIEIDPLEMFGRLAPVMAETIAQWDRGRGFAAIRQDWLRAAHGVGSEVRLSLQDDMLVGTFEDIDPAGYLCLRLASGELRRISAGDLFF